MGDPSNEEKMAVSKAKGGIKLAVVAIVVVIVILLAVIGVLAYKLIGNKKEEPKEQKGVITAENVEEVMDEWIGEEEEQNVPAYYTVVQNTEWTFPDGASPSTDATVENDTENETPVYFDVIVDATGETVFSSPVLELGAKIANFKLDKALEKGDYECTVVYHLVDENQKELTTVNVGTTIHIEN